MILSSVTAFALSSDMPSLFTIEEDTGGTTPPPEENPNAGFFNTIINWLTGFWDKLIEIVAKIFIPSEGYFENFFNEISLAFGEKTKGLGSVFEGVKSLFDGLNSVTGETALTMTIPNNHFYSGYSGITVNFLNPKLKPLLDTVRSVFNSVLVLFTSIICIKKLIALIQT